MGKISSYGPGDPAPEVCLPDQNGTDRRTSEMMGKWLVLYFYPKDDTPGCTKEAIDFTSNIDDFEKEGAAVLGISPDSCSSHRKFIDKKGLKLTLLSDPEHDILDSFGVWQEKSMYGKKYMGVDRSTFLVDPEGIIRHVWRGVKVEGHAEEVLKTLRDLKG
ncbi:MAG: thioredoxin-dependent thiol peroxidase [Candidatus Thermoplasmatota archaeon]|nr:thioredoxin-dependent thiol peroxidase [Candidatus Thermoplasmatota archaeon]